MTTPSFIVLGTDTDAGKTTFSALWLASSSGYDYWKPVETGESDSETIRRLVPTTVVHPPLARFREPVAPPLAAKREGRTIPPAAEIAAQLPHTENGLLIETFGGPFSPLNETELQIELVRQLGLPCVLVGSSAIGAVGRTLQALTALASFGVVPAAVVLMGPVDDYALGEIGKLQPDVLVFAVAENLYEPWGLTPRSLSPHVVRDIVEKLKNEDRGVKPHGSSEWVAADGELIWHPYTSLQHATPPLPVVAAEAEFLHLADGRRLIDAVSSWWTILHGHRHPPLVAALKQAADTLDHVLFAGATHPPAVRFAELLLRTVPWKNGRVFFSDNGSTAVEVALKMAYQRWCHRGEPRRKLFIGFEHAYHGDTFGAMSVGRDRLFFGPFEPLLFDAVQLPLDPNRLDEFLKERGSEVAGVIVEPLIQAAGGMRMHSPGMLRDLFTVAKRHGIPFIADEVMTGNRTGRRWAFQHAGIAPDLICAAKTLTGGMMPLSVTLASPEIVTAFDTADRAKTFFHGHSFTAHPLACAVAAVNEELIAEPGVLERGEAVGRMLLAELEPLRQHPRVADVRACGSVVAVEVKAEGGYLAAEVEQWKAVALDRGVFLRPLGNVLYAMPPLGSSEESLRRIAGAIRALL